MKLRIAYVITRAEIGGGQSHVLDLIQGFRDELDVHLITGERGYLTEAAESCGVPAHVLPTLVQPLRPGLDARALFGLIRLMRRIQPDLVHSHTSKAGILARAAAACCRIPSVFTAHTWCFAEGTSRLWHLIGKPLEQGASRVTRKIITVSEANRQLAIRHGLPPAKIRTVHNGIADSPHLARPGAADQTVKILIAARFVPQKDHGALLRAISTMADVEVLLAGDGPLRPQYVAMAAVLGICRRVHFLGDRRDIPQLLAESHIFALPSRWEGFPISILEAMRAGLPVVASDVGGVREAVAHGQTGFTTTPGDDADFAARLRALVESPVLRGDFGKAARRAYERDFTRQTMLERTQAIYQEAVPMWKKKKLSDPAPAQKVTT